MTLTEMLDRLRRARIARLATVDRVLRPHLVPVVFAADDQFVYSAVDAKPKRTLRLQRLRNIEAHPQVALLVDHYQDDWSQLWWVRVDGQARVSQEEADRRRALALLEEKYRQYRSRPPPGPVVVIEIDRITGWSAAEHSPDRPDQPD